MPYPSFDEHAKALNAAAKQESIVVKAEFEDRFEQVFDEERARSYEKMRETYEKQFENPPGKIERLDRPKVQTNVAGPGDGSAFMPIVYLWRKLGIEWRNEQLIPVLVKLQWKNADEAREFALNLLDACNRAERGIKDPR